mgnify:FL=1
MIVDVGVWISIFNFLTIVNSIAIVVVVFSVVDAVVVAIVWIWI